MKKTNTSHDERYHCFFEAQENENSQQQDFAEKISDQVVTKREKLTNWPFI